MKGSIRSNIWGFIAVASIACAAFQPHTVSAAEPAVIYFTGFEVSEGFDPRFTLIGQKDWVGFGSGGNGLVTNFFPGLGQQAYVGFTPPSEREETLNVWRPVDLAPIPTNQTLITFSVLMQIVDSRNGQFDDFRWSVYNTNGARLFSVDFDNSALLISYGLDDTAGFVQTGLAFDNQGFYELTIKMNFARNVWSAMLNDFVIVNSKPMTTTGAALNLGDIDAVWSIHRPGSPGDNYMIFDNYTILAESSASIAPRIEMSRFQANGQFGFRVFGEQGLNYAVEASENMKDWQIIKVVTAPAGGVFEFQDPDSTRIATRMYRVRHQLATAGM